MQLDSELMGDLIAELISEHVAKSIRPLQEEIATLRSALAAFVVPKDGKDADPELVRAEVARAVAEIPKPEDGKSVDLGVLFTEIGAAVARAVEALPKVRDGKDADPEDVRAEIARQLAILPRPRDGKDFDPAALDIALARATEETHGFIAEQVEKQVAALPKPIDEAAMDTAITMAMREMRDFLMADTDTRLSNMPKPINGKDGADADPEFIRATIAAELAAIPKPQDGKSVDMDELQPVIISAVDNAVAQIPTPADGKSVDPNAVATMIRAEVERVVAEMPTPKDGDDGEPGKDGHDGVQLEDIDIDLKGDRTLVFSLMSAGRMVEKEVKLPWPIDRGSFKSGKHYDQGDCVTYAGNLWIATADTSEAPGVGPAALWRMAVKRGKDGRGADAS